MVGALVRFRDFCASASDDNWVGALAREVFWCAAALRNNWAGALARKVFKVAALSKRDNVEGALVAGDFGDAPVDDMAGLLLLLARTSAQLLTQGRDW